MRAGFWMSCCPPRARPPHGGRTASRCDKPGARQGADSGNVRDHQHLGFAGSDLLTAAQRRLPSLQRFCWKSRTKCDAVVTFIAQRSVVISQLITRSDPHAPRWSKPVRSSPDVVDMTRPRKKRRTRVKTFSTNYRRSLTEWEINKATGGWNLTQEPSFSGRLLTAAQ
jgi:hypothetical protein